MDLKRGSIPRPFQSKHSLGWPSVAQWLKFGSDAGEGSNHFHLSVANDRYFVLPGTWHFVINDPKYQPVAVAYDDEWPLGFSENEIHLSPRSI